MIRFKVQDEPSSPRSPCRSSCHSSPHLHKLLNILASVPCQGKERTAAADKVLGGRYKTEEVRAAVLACCREDEQHRPNRIGRGARRKRREGRTVEVFD